MSNRDELDRLIWHTKLTWGLFVAGWVLLVAISILAALDEVLS